MFGRLGSLYLLFFAFSIVEAKAQEGINIDCSSSQQINVNASKFTAECKIQNIARSIVILQSIQPQDEHCVSILSGDAEKPIKPGKVVPIAITCEGLGDHFFNKKFVVSYIYAQYEGDQRRNALPEKKIGSISGEGVRIQKLNFSEREMGLKKKLLNFSEYEETCTDIRLDGTGGAMFPISDVTQRLPTCGYHVAAQMNDAWKFKTQDMDVLKESRVFSSKLEKENGYYYSLKKGSNIQDDIEHLLAHPPCERSIDDLVTSNNLTSERAENMARDIMDFIEAERYNPSSEFMGYFPDLFNLSSSRSGGLSVKIGSTLYETFNF